LLGNKSVDLLAKQAAVNRASLLLMNAAEEAFTIQLTKARQVVSWLAEQMWPDSKAVGKVPGLKARSAEGCLKTSAMSHAWVWSGCSRRCRTCGAISFGGFDNGKCGGLVDRSKIHELHLIRTGRIGDEADSPLTICIRCGCSRTAGKGLQDPRRWRHPVARRRLDLISRSVHPYSKLHMVPERAELAELEVGDVGGFAGTGMENTGGSDGSSTHSQVARGSSASLANSPLVSQLVGSLALHGLQELAD
jgi:hypothetical protein